MPDAANQGYDNKRTRAAGPLGRGGTSRDDPAIGESPDRADGSPIELRSAAFDDHDLIPARYAFENDNTPPPLEWSGTPAGTEELVLICEDPDAADGTFVHWLVTGIPPTASGIDGDRPGEAVTGRNGSDDVAWGGPHPPVGDEAHRYFFRLYAVDRRLGLGSDASAEDAYAAMKGHVLARGTLVGQYAR
jgi:Raf kinase inhibitor-like YbhB/YbcL family protein